MNCKYCGTEITEEDLFCPMCGNETDAEQLQTSDDLTGNTAGAAWGAAGTSEAMNAEDGTTEYNGISVQASAPVKPENEVPVSSGKERSILSDFTRAYMALAIMLCCAILIGCGFCVYSLSHTKSLEGQVRRANSDYQTAAATIEDLNTQLADAQSELETVQSENDTLTGQVTTLTDQVTALEGDVTQYQYDASAAEQNAEYASGQIATLNGTITGLETDLAAANEANETLQSDNDTLTEENGTLQTENETLQEANNTLTEENEAYEAKVAFYDQYVVFVVVGDKNKYYHTYDCKDFTKNSFLAYSVKLAEQNGYSPCPVCHASTTAASQTTAPAQTAAAHTTAAAN